MMNDCWDILRIEPTDDLRAVKRAYARQLKSNSPEDDPEAFQQLRRAYEEARWLAESGYAELDDEFDEEFEADFTDDEELAEDEELFEPSEDDYLTDEFECAVDPIGQLYEEADELAAELLSADESEPSIRRVLDDPRLQSLQFREIFEEALAAQFYNRDEPPSLRLALVAEEFNWHEIGHPLQYRYPGLFESAAELRAALEARRWLEYVASERSKRWTNHRRAARIVLGMRPARRYRDRARIRRLVEYMHKRVGPGYADLIEIRPLLWRLKLGDVHASESESKANGCLILFAIPVLISVVGVIAEELQKLNWDRDGNTIIIIGFVVAMSGISYWAWRASKKN
jgi:hypothetical protein